jgi:hypothetical protein
MNKTYVEALETVLSAKVDRMNTLSDLVEAQEQGTAEKEEIKQLLAEADRAEQEHNEAVKIFTVEAIKSISDILETLKDVISEK